jgi:hypothetical protein
VLIIVAAIAVVLRLWPLMVVSGTERAMDPNGDSVGYVDLAHGLSSGCGFARLSNGKCMSPQINRTPGYPLFLSLMPDLRIALAVQALLSGLMIFVLGAFVSSRWGLSAGLIAATLVALDVPSIVYSNEIMSETLFTVFFVLGVLAALSARPRGNRGQRFALVTLSSILFGAAILVRPIGQFAVLAPAMIPLAFAGVSWPRRIGYVALIVSIPAMVVAGWSARNYRVSGVASFSTIGAINFFYYRAGGTLAYASHVGWEAELKKLTPPDKRAGFTRQAIKIIAHHPVAFVEMTTWTLLYLCFVPDRAPLSHLLGVQQSFPIVEPARCERARPLPLFIPRRARPGAPSTVMNFTRRQHCWR